MAGVGHEEARVNETVRHVVCPHCDSVNRLPAARDARTAKCGKCHQPLFTGQPLPASTAGFLKQIERNDIPVVADFWADWCGPCKQMAPEFEKAARALEPHVRFAKLDTEAAPNEAASHGIRSIPTMILFQNGREAARQSGAMPAGHIIQWVREQIGA